MVLSDRDILDLVGLIEPITPVKVQSEGDVKMSYGIDPQGYTFRLGVFQSGTNYTTRGFKDTYIINPREGGSITSLERFNLPDNLMGLFRGKSSYTRNGLIFSTATVDAGYNGYLSFWVFNGGHSPIHLYLEQGIAQINFLPLTASPTQAYKGLY